MYLNIYVGMISVKLYEKSIFQRVCIFKRVSKIEMGFYALNITVCSQMFMLFGKECQFIILEMIFKVVLFSLHLSLPWEIVQGSIVCIYLQLNSCYHAAFVIVFKTQENNHGSDTVLKSGQKPKSIWTMSYMWF